MATRQLDVEGIGKVTLHKRRGARYVRLSINPRGGVRVSMPSWLPYKAGLTFLETRRAWLQQNIKQPAIMTDGQRVGKAHRLNFVVNTDATKPSSRVRNSVVTVQLPASIAQTSDVAQKIAERAAVRALKIEAQTLLPQRLEQLASKTGLMYKSITIKSLKSRWGSCNSQKDIVLNTYLIQLPWHLIDYVIIHELSHTKVMAHGKPFWAEMDKHLKNVKQLRGEIKKYQANLA